MFLNLLEDNLFFKGMKMSSVLKEQNQERTFILKDEKCAYKRGWGAGLGFLLNYEMKIYSCLYFFIIFKFQLHHLSIAFPLILSYIVSSLIPEDGYK